MKAELKSVAQKFSEDNRQGGCVRPSDCDINQNQKPRTQEAVVIAESFFCVGISAAGVRIFIHHEVVIVADNQHAVPSGPPIGKKVVPGMTNAPQPTAQPNDNAQTFSGDK